jgi:hypothetical protein
MSPESIFSTANAIAMVGWLVLLVLPRWRSVDQFIIGVIVTLFSLAYVFVLFHHFNFGDAKKFGSLQGVMELFSHPELVVAGWIHYLAFDLMTGLFIVKNARLHGIQHGFVVPCLLFTFMLGPTGLLLYLLIRWIITKQYFANNFSN